MTVRKNSVDESQKALNAFLELTEASGSKQVFAHFKITKKRWIHVGRDRSSL